MAPYGRAAIRRDEAITISPTEGQKLCRQDGKRDRGATPAEAAALIAGVLESERALWTCAGVLLHAALTGDREFVV